MKLLLPMVFIGLRGFSDPLEEWIQGDTWCTYHLSPMPNVQCAETNSWSDDDASDQEPDVFRTFEEISFQINPVHKDEGNNNYEEEFIEQTEDNSVLDKLPVWHPNGKENEPGSINIQKNKYNLILLGSRISETPYLEIASKLKDGGRYLLVDEKIGAHVITRVKCRVKRLPYRNSIEDKRALVLQQKTLAAEFFKAKNLKSAKALYKVIVKYTTPVKELNDITATILLNLCSVYYSCQQHSKAAIFATKSIELVDSSLARKKRAIARLACGLLEEALVDLNIVKENGNDDSSINALIHEAKTKIRESTKLEKNRYGKMLHSGSLYREQPNTFVLKKRVVKEPNGLGGFVSLTRGVIRNADQYRALPQAVIEIAIDGVQSGRLTFVIFQDATPKTAANFLAYINGTKAGHSYCGTEFHRVIEGFMAQGGSIPGVKSIYGKNFDDENFMDAHEGRGWLAMANKGQNTNGTQFYITFDATPHLDGKHVVFGRLIHGFDVLDSIEALSNPSDGPPSKSIIITNCSQNTNENMFPIPDDFADEPQAEFSLEPENYESPIDSLDKYENMSEQEEEIIGDILNA